MIHFAIPITTTDPSQVGRARRQAATMANAFGMKDVRAGELSIVVTESARNIAAHAGEGHLILSPWSVQREGEVKRGVDIFALDHGPGIFDVSQATQDGFSTAGTAGEGLGAIARLADIQQIYSTPGGSESFHTAKGTYSPNSDISGSGHRSGTAVFARFLQNVPAAKVGPDDLKFGVISVPVAGEEVCGDAWASIQSKKRSVHIIADGLGHGPFAAEAANEAIRIFEANSEYAPERILQEIHRALTKTRGAAVSIAEVLPPAGVVNYSGTGNISAAIYSGGKTKNLVSMNGTAGHSVAKFQQFSYPWEPHALLIMHSDGLATRWNLEQYAGLGSRHPALIAAVLYRDFCRGRDDVTVLAASQ